MTGIHDKNYYANVEQDFLPDGGRRQVWDMIDNAGCNKCHNPLSAHGGSRRDVKLCVLCHRRRRPIPTRQHRRLQGDGPQDPPRREAAERRGRHAVPDHRNGSPTTTTRPSSSRRTSATARPATRAAPANAGAVGTGTRTRAARPARRATTTSTASTGRESPGRRAGRRQRVRQLPRPAGRGVGRLHHGRAHRSIKSTQLKGLKAEIVAVTNAAPGQNPTVAFTHHPERRTSSPRYDRFGVET